MNVGLFLGLIFFLGAASLWLGRSAGRQTKTNDEYFLMGRQLGLFSLVMTLLATQIGGGSLLGASEEAFARGWGVLFYPMGMVLGFLVLGFGYGAKMRTLNLTTIPEIFETIYRSKALRQIASVLSIVSLYIILIGQGIAARKFFVSLGYHGDLLFLLFWSVLITYTVMGGLRAVVKTDILQTLFILGAFAIAIVAALKGASSSASSFAPQAPSTTPTPWLTWLLMPLFFMLIEQDMGQRCFAAKNPRIVSIAAITAALFLLLVSFVPIYFGAKAASLGISVEPGGSVLIAAVKAMTSPAVATIVICAILMAIISTADSLLCSVSSNIVCDFPALGRSLRTSQTCTLIVGVSTLGLAFLFDNVLAMLMFSYQIAVSVLFVSVTMAIWKKGPLKRSAGLSMLMGGGAFALFKLFPPPLPGELIALALSFISFWASEILPAASRKRITKI